MPRKTGPQGAKERRCPICKGLMPAGENRHAPFCSARCRMVDLGRWLGGAYAVPGEEAPPEELERSIRDEN